MLAPAQIFGQSIPSPDWSYFDLGPFRIHAYALCILAGIIVAGMMTSRRLTQRGAEPGIVLDIIFAAVPIGIIGARAYHVFTHPGDYFFEGANLWRTTFIWEGGNAIFGALIGGALGAWIGCRYSGIRFWTFADAVAPGLLVAQALGRIGNWFNHELFGVPTNAWWGLQIEPTNPAFPGGLPEGTLFHPTFLYEIIWNLVGVLLILALERRFRLQWGKVLGLYLIWYGLGRSWLESIRIDPSEIYFGVRTNIWAAWLAILVGIVIIIVQSRRHTGAEPSPYRAGRQWHANAAVDSVDDEAYYDENGVIHRAQMHQVDATAQSGEATGETQGRKTETGQHDRTNEESVGAGR